MSPTREEGAPPPVPTPPADKPAAPPKPQTPGPGELPKPPVAPAAVHATAVVTTDSGLKYGWQQAPVRSIPDPQACSHIGTVSAKAQLVVHEVGHEWVCECGQFFVVEINRGGKKTLVEKETPESD